MTKEELEEDIKIGEILRFKTKDCEIVGKVDSFGSSGIKLISLDTNKPKRIAYEFILEYDFDVNESESKNSDILNSLEQNAALNSNVVLGIPELKKNEAITSYEDDKEDSNLKGKITKYVVAKRLGIISCLSRNYNFRNYAVKNRLLAKNLNKGIVPLPIDVVFDTKKICTKSGQSKMVAVNVRLESNYTFHTLAYSSFCSNKKERKISVDDNAYNSYFELARQADLYEKNLDKTIFNYKKAIESKQNLSASVLNLVLIYSRLEMKSEALDLLEKYKYDLDYPRYLNTKIQILQKGIEKKDAAELIRCLTEAKKMPSSYEKRLFLDMNIARIYFQIEDFDKAEKAFSDILSNKHIDPPRRKYILRVLCNINLKKSNETQAKEYANKILIVDPEDEFALSVVNNTYSTENDIIEEDFDCSSSSKESPFISDKIDQLNLKTELKKSKKIDEDNIFKGSEKDAEILISALTYQETGNDGAKANQNYACAKIIRQIMERESYEKNPHITENEYFHHIAYGALYSGYQRLYTNSDELKNLDSSRYLYLESAKSTKFSKKIHPCWHRAVLSFFKTFFTEDEVAIKSLPRQKKSTQDPSNDFFIELSKILDDNLKQSSKVFTSGIFECIEYEERNKKLIIDCLEKSHLKQQLIAEFSNLYKKDSNVFFYNLAIEAFNKYISLRSSFLRSIISTINNLDSLQELSSNLDKIENSEFIEYLNKTDSYISSKLFEILGSLLKYYKESDFNYKSEVLKSANEKRDLLEEYISKNPTRFGYDLLLPRIKDLQAKIYKESQSLYRNSIPEIDIKIDNDLTTVNPEEKTVSFVVNFTNKVNIQNADNVKISVESKKAKNLASEELSRDVITGNGKPIQKRYQFEVTEDLLKEKFLPISISVSYEYFKNMKDKLSKEQTWTEISVPLSKEKFESIKNKFSKYSGGMVVETDDMFFGRSKDIERIISQVCDSEGRIHSGKSLALYGQKRTGKTSLLYHVEKKLREKDSSRNIIIKIGTLGLIDFSGGINQFFLTVLNVLKSELLDNHKDFYEKLKLANIVIDSASLEKDKEQVQFNKIFKDLCMYIKDNNTGHNIILMIDEFTYVYKWIRQGTMTDRFMKFWKGFIQNNNIYAIIIGQDHMMQFVSDPNFTNDFGSTELQKVTYLSESDAKRMMQEPIMIKRSMGLESRYKDGALDKLYELTSGSAYLIMKLCAGLVDYINDVIKNPYITIAYIDEYLKNNLSSFEESKYFDPLYSDESCVNSEEITEKNKLLLKRIAQLAPRKEWSPIDKVILEESDRKLLDKLEERDVIIIEEGQRCKIKVALYKEWILAKYGEKL